MDYFIGFVFGWFAISVLTACVAGSRGRSTFGWFLCAMIIGIIALFLVLYLPVISKGDKLDNCEGDYIDIYVEKDFVAPILRSPVFDDAILMKSGEIYSVCGICYNPIIKKNSDLKRCIVCDASLSYRTEINLADAAVLNKRYIAELNARNINANQYDKEKYIKIKITRDFIYESSSTNNTAPSILEIIRVINGLNNGRSNIKEYINRINSEINPNLSTAFVDLFVGGMGLWIMINSGNISVMAPIMIGYMFIKLISYFVRRSKKSELVKAEEKSLALADVIKRHEQILAEKVTTIVACRVKDLGAIELSKILIDLKVEKYKYRIKRILDSCNEFQVIALAESDDVLYRSLAQENGGNITTVYLDDDEDLRDDGSNQMA